MGATFESFGRYATEWTDAGANSLMALSEGAQTIAAEASEYTRKNIAMSSAAVEDLLCAQSVESAIGIQAAFARQAYEAFVSEAARIGDFYAELARDAYKPFESMAAKAR